MNWEELKREESRGEIAWELELKQDCRLGRQFRRQPEEHIYWP